MKNNLITKIPTGWEVKKLKYVLDFQVGWTPSTTKQSSFEGNNIWVTIGDLNGKFIDNSSIQISNDAIAENRMKTVPKGALMYSFKLSIGKIAFADIDLYTNEAIISILPNNEKYNLDFFYYSLPLDLIHSANNNIYGAKILNQELINNALLTLPPLPTQQKIATFLDQKTTEIDNLISKKNKMISLLKEEEKAFINEKLQEKTNWTKKKLKYLVLGKLAYGANEIAEYDDVNFPRYIRITDFGEDGNLRNNTFKSLPNEIAKDYLLQEGDILFARSGATVGKTFQFKDYKGIACFAGYLIKATPNPDVILSDFLYYFTKSNHYENWKNSIFVQATIQNIGADKYNNLTISLPSLSVQSEIVSAIGLHLSKSRLLIEKSMQEVILLKEYRQSLISECVSGGMEV